jgi:hypothetical protein
MGIQKPIKSRRALPRSNAQALAGSRMYREMAPIAARKAKMPRLGAGRVLSGNRKRMSSRQEYIRLRNRLVGPVNFL